MLWALCVCLLTVAAFADGQKLGDEVTLLEPNEVETKGIDPKNPEELGTLEAEPQDPEFGVIW